MCVDKLSLHDHFGRIRRPVAVEVLRSEVLDAAAVMRRNPVVVFPLRLDNAPWGAKLMGEQRATHM